MKLRPGDGNDDAFSFQLAPMVDIIFVVLVFFVATYAVSKEEKLLGLDLPRSASGQPEFRQRQQIVVNLDASGKVFIERRPFEILALENRLVKLVAFSHGGEGPSVIIRADGACQHRHVIEVMDCCARAGVKSVHFSTLPQE